MTGMEKLKNELESMDDKLLSYFVYCEELRNGKCKNTDRYDKEYSSLSAELEGIANKMFQEDMHRKHQDEWDLFDERVYDLNYNFQRTLPFVNAILAKRVNQLEKTYTHKQSVDLAVFSVVLSALAFIMTNVSLLAAEPVNFINVLLVNLSFLLGMDVLFTLIYAFLGPLFYEKLSTSLKITLAIIPAVLIGAICYIAI